MTFFFSTFFFHHHFFSFFLLFFQDQQNIRYNQSVKQFMDQKKWYPLKCNQPCVGWLSKEISCHNFNWCLQGDNDVTQRWSQLWKQYWKELCLRSVKPLNGCHSTQSDKKKKKVLIKSRNKFSKLQWQYPKSNLWYNYLPHGTEIPNQRCGMTM